VTSRLLALAATLALLAGCSSGAKPSENRSGGEQTLVELRAVVVGVDQQRRLVTLESDDGGILVLPVAEEFPDFDRLRLGDPIIVSYTEAVSSEAKPADGGAASDSAITITAKITASIRRARPSR